MGPEDAGVRLDRFLAAREELSRSRWKQLIEAGDVEVNGASARPSQALACGDEISARLRARPRSDALVGEPVPLRILYEDEHLVVLDKHAGLVVHPAPGHRHGTLVHGLIHRYGDRLSTFADAGRPGIVHRLDRGTTGAMVVALTDTAHQRLAAQFAERRVDKEYLAVVYGRPDARAGTIDVAIGRDRRDRTRISSRTDKPREAITRWELAEDLRAFALLRAFPRTGRTHQVRAHLAHINHGLVGDDLYAGRQWRGVPEGRVRSAVAAFPRPALHAHRLAFDHPASGERVRFEAPLAEDIERLLALLREWRDGR